MIKPTNRFTAEKVTNEIKTFAPKLASDTEEIILFMKNSPCIVTTSYSKVNHAQRIIDILLGAAVALSIKICVLDNENYLFTKE